MVYTPKIQTARSSTVTWSKIAALTFSMIMVTVMVRTEMRVHNNVLLLLQPGPMEDPAFSHLLQVAVGSSAFLGPSLADNDRHKKATSVVTDETPQPKYAYMFLIGGIDLSKPGYRGFLYNVVVAAHLLKTNGSRADVVLFLQMAPDVAEEALPINEEQALLDVGIKIKYMEKPTHATFSDIMMEKFRILTLTEYSRVIFMDSDVMPVASMDYLMELSSEDHPLLMQNAVHATKGEPSNGGWFMVAPKEGDYGRLLKIIDDQRESVKNDGYPFWNKEYGWGHSFIKEGDEWAGTNRGGNRWQFHGAHVDQGLLYYWTKYHQKEVTIFRGNTVENWGNDTDGKPFLQASMDPSFISQHAGEERSIVLHRCHKKQSPDNYHCKIPYRDFFHFTGKRKPWQTGYDNGNMSRERTEGQYDIWFNTLFDLSDTFNWNITVDNINEKLQAESPVGYMPSWGDMARRQQNWTDTSSNNTKP